MDKDTLKIVVTTLVAVLSGLATTTAIVIILLPIVLSVCNATSVKLTFIEYVIRLFLATIVFMVIYYKRQKLMLATKDFMSASTLMSSSLKPLRDMIIACSITMIVLIFFFNPQMFGLNTPTFVDYLITFVGKYNIDVSALDSCWLAEK